jgi:parallel beta-helix repeat protein
LGNFAAVWATDYYGGVSVTTQAFVDRSVATGGFSGFYAENYYAVNTSRIFVTDSVVSDNAGTGIYSGLYAGTAEATATNNRVFRNAYGLFVGGSGGKLIATGNTVTKNGNGLFQSTSGVLESAGDNVVRDNTTNVSGSITTTFAKM